MEDIHWSHQQCFTTLIKHHWLIVLEKKESIIDIITIFTVSDSLVQYLLFHFDAYLQVNYFRDILE